jgi:peroxiredoxin 2/4
MKDENGSSISTFPRLNEPAPDFKAKTTHGDRSLADYKGKWLILFSHPADFTPVCTTEFIGFAKSADTFKSMNCELLGPVDRQPLLAPRLDAGTSRRSSASRSRSRSSRTSRWKWPVPTGWCIRAPPTPRPYARPSSSIPTAILRAMVYYPMSNGRSIDEFVRLLQAMQTSDKNKVATPEGWKPGCDVIVPPPKTAAAIADKRPTEGYKTVDWYYSTKSL